MDRPAPRPTRGPDVVIGLLAAAAGLGVGHLVAGLVAPAASPILAVGSNVIDVTPHAVKTWAIDQFGTADKSFLVTVVVLVTIGASVAAGMASRARPWAGAAILAGLGTVATVAAWRSPAAGASGTGFGHTVWPGLAATAVAVGTLVGLRRSLTAVEADVPGLRAGPGTRADHPTDHSADATRTGRTNRRRFLAGAAGASGAAVVGWTVGNHLGRTGATPDLPPLHAASPAPPLPAALDRTVPGISALRTPARDFYRVDTALLVPRVDASTWRLHVDGDVDHPFDLTYDELLRLPLIERDLTLLCVSNEVGGPYVSSGRWLGVRTRDVLARAGIRPGVDQILSRSVDGMTISTPLQALTDRRDAMIAVGLNGEALPRRNGYPARLVTPGLYGFVGATKWLDRLTATTYAARTAYWTAEGWATDGRVKTESRIDTPRAGARLAEGPVLIGGVAWAPRRGIARVEVRIDDGPWREAVLGPEANVDYWRQWYLRWRATGVGDHTITVRATDGTGAVQTAEEVPPYPDGASDRPTVTVRVG